MLTGPQILRVLEALREIDSMMQLNRAQTLIWVALNSGRHQLDLQNELEFSNATALRNIEWWSGVKGDKSSVSSPKFVTSYQDPSDKRYRCVELTKVVKRLWIRFCPIEASSTSYAGVVKLVNTTGLKPVAQK